MSLEEKKKYSPKWFSPVRYDQLGSITTMYTTGKLQPNGYYLPAKYVIHGRSIGYLVEDSDLNLQNALHLKNAYLECLQKVKVLGIRTVAFPCISTGKQGFPRLEAAKIALSTVREWLSDESNASQVDAIIFCIYRDTINWKVYTNLMPQYFPSDPQDINKDLVEVWLNSIHTCSPSPESGIPPVILVGTHSDQIPQNCRQKVCESVFTQIRYQLRDKPTRFHLANEDFVIDNTVFDLKLEELKRKIVELASQQPFWGEEVPARWLHLEQVLMKLKAAGAKVIPYSLVETLNKAGTIQIETKEELDLFLRFLHDMGTILYFNTVRLRDKVVFDPQWLIDALKSLITAEMFVLKLPATIDKWYEFKEKGKLTPELIDAVWTKQENPELHDNKEHILLLMEQLNIVARPRSFSENGDEVKVENYLIAPCMLRQMTPGEVITPEPNPQMESTSVLSYVFREKFLPPPIFHRLIVSCVACWPIAKQNLKNLIFCGCCIFDLDLSHRLYLHLRDYIIFARITRMGIKERTPNVKVCRKVREFITEKLSEILGCFCQRLDFEMCIQCSQCDGDSFDKVVPLSVLQENAELACHSHVNSHVIISHDLLKSWFEDEVCSGEDKVDDPSSCLPLSLLDQVPLEKHLNRLSMKIGKEYVQLGLELDVPWSRIEQIQMENPHIAMQCFKILQEWVHRDGGQATFRNLEKVILFFLHCSY